MYINGSKTGDYVETNATTVTFTETRNEGDTVRFEVNERSVDATSTPASSVTLTVQNTSYNVSSYLNSIDTLTASKTYDWASVASQATATTTLTVTGALTTHTVDAYMDIDLLGINLTSYVSSTNTVTIRATNPTGSPIDLASGTLTARVHKV